MELSTILYSIGKWSGVIGFFCLSFLIFSGDTARFWDRWFGLDRIIKFQRKFSLFTALFVIMHPLFFILALGNISGFLVPDFAYVPLAIGILAFYIFVLVMIASQLYKRVSYKAWQYIHVITYVLFFMAIYHAFKWGSDAQLFTPAYLIVFTAVIVGAIYRMKYKIVAMRRGSFTVQEVIPETHDSFTLRIKTDKPFEFEAGQFAFLRLDGMRLHARHPFTIASEPHEDELRFTIKDSGRFTAAARALSPGAKIAIDGPFGKFKIVPDKKLIFVAGGVGITPFMSMILHNSRSKSPQDITLIYGSKTESDIIFKKKFDEINAPWFKKVYVLSNTENVTSGCEKGFVNADLIKKYAPGSDDSIYYICGPEIMKNNVSKALTSLGIPSSRMRIEDFFW